VGGSEGLVAEIAGAILDGTPVDWVSLESSANPTERSFLEHLRVVAAVADIQAARRTALRSSRKAGCWLAHAHCTPHAGLLDQRSFRRGDRLDTRDVHRHDDCAALVFVS
jgi:hypothetical protein